VHDNSADNPQNPSNPPIRVRWGEQTLDEMSLAFLNLVAVDGGNLGGREVAMQSPGAMQAPPKPDYAERAKATIKKIDTDGNGRLSFAEVKTAVGDKHTKEVVDKTLARFDADGDKQLNLNETAAALRVLQP